MNKVIEVNMREREYQQCTRCVMDTSDKYIVFDGKGQCNHCTEFIERTSKLTYQGKLSEQMLNKELEKIKKSGKNNKYDCLIGVSGGVDSCYVAYVAKNMGLRPLAVHMDNGWNSEEAVNNIKNVCGKLGIDYQSYVLDWEEFKDIQLAFLKSSIVEIEMPTDTAILGALHKVAAENNIEYVISGGNYATEGILPDSWFYDPKDFKLLKSIHKIFGTRKMKSFPAFDFKSEAYYKFIKGIKLFYILNYVPFSKEEAIKTLENELDWQNYGGKHYESKFTGFVQSYIQPVKFNVDYRRATFSTQICTGEITREEALKELKKLSYKEDTIQAEKEYVSKKLGITINEFEALMNAPAKTYKDYPNSEKNLNFIYGVYRRFFGKKPTYIIKDHQSCLICSSIDLNLLAGYEYNNLVKCADCGFVFTTQEPTEKELLEHYNQYSRDDYLPPLTIKRYNELLDEMEVYRKTNNLLDVGSGMGYFLEQAKLRGWNVYGTEFTDEAMSICKSKGADMRQGVLSAEWFKEGFFDVITSFEVIEHINNPQIELSNSSKILRKGGLFYCTTPNFNSFSRRYLKNKWNNILYPEHLSYYTTQTLTKVFAEHNLWPKKTLTTGVSLARIKSSRHNEKRFVPITTGSADEILRNQFEKGAFYRRLKKLINSILTLFRLGDTIKIYAIKK